MTTIAIISQKGGAGKTTLALHLAACASDAGLTALVLDLDPQGTAIEWGMWRKDAPPEVIGCFPSRLAEIAAQAGEKGAELIVVDTPPHADAAAVAAMGAADMVMIPCRPSAFDLASIRTTARLVGLHGGKARAVFMAGPVKAPRMYDEARELVADLGIEAAPMMLPDRAAFRHAAGQGKTVMEFEPGGKAAGEVRALYAWVMQQAHGAVTMESAA